MAAQNEFIFQVITEIQRKLDSLIETLHKHAIDEKSAEEDLEEVRTMVFELCGDIKALQQFKEYHDKQEQLLSEEKKRLEQVLEKKKERTGDRIFTVLFDLLKLGVAATMGGWVSQFFHR